MEYRHEWKHEINYSDLQVLRQRLRLILQPDPHAVAGKYQIRSLYFDSPTDTALRDKLDGVSRREKYRLRYYNGDAALIFLEKKSKLGNLCNKQHAVLTYSQAQALAAGDPDCLLHSEQPLLQELRQKMQTKLLRPKVIVDYTREPYIYAPGNVRITMDYDIRSTLQTAGFLDSACPTIPVADGQIFLEVKWGAFLPSVIRDAIQLEDRHASAFSKYAAGRIYG